MAGMMYLRSSIPLRALLWIYGFALTVGYLRWRGKTRGKTPLSRKARWLTFGFALAIFIFIATLNAVQNSRLGLPQF
jgi:hypothetical protein